MQGSLFLCLLLGVLQLNAQEKVCAFGNWTLAEPFAGGSRDDGSAFSFRNLGYYGCGIDAGYQLRNDWWRFNPNENSWTEVESIPGMARQYATVFSTPNSVYLVGGSTSIGYSNEVFRFNPHDEHWVQLADAPFPGRAAAFAFSINQMCYYGTGRGDSVYFNDFWRYNSVTEEWNELEKLPFEPRFEMVGFTALGKGYALLGRDSNSWFADVWQFDPIKMSWAQITDYPGMARSYAACVENEFGAIIAGGMGATNDVNSTKGLLSEAYSFNALSSEWTRIEDCPTGSVRGMDGFQIDNEIFLCGGLTHDFIRLDVVQHLDVECEQNVRLGYLYPNPARNELRFYWNQIGSDDIAQAEIYDQRGFKVLGMTITGSELLVELPVSNLANGIYYFRITTDSNSFSSSFVISK